MAASTLARQDRQDGQDRSGPLTTIDAASIRGSGGWPATTKDWNRIRLPQPCHDHVVEPINNFAIVAAGAAK
jgi:hypothetical protein